MAQKFVLVWVSSDEGDLEKVRKSLLSHGRLVLIATRVLPGQHLRVLKDGALVVESPEYSKSNIRGEVRTPGRSPRDTRC